MDKTVVIVAAPFDCCLCVCVCVCVCVCACVQSVFNGMHVVFIPYSIMKIDPASWMKMVTRYKGKCSSVCVKQTT